MRLHIIYQIILIKIVFFLPSISVGEDIFLLTETKTITNKTVRICGETLFTSMTRPTHISTPQIFPGQKILDVINENDNGDTLFELFSSASLEVGNSLQDDGIYYTLVDKFGVIKDLRFFVTEPNWEVLKIFPHKEPTSGSRMYVVFQRQKRGNLSLGRVLVFDVNNNDFLQTPATEIPIPFAPDTICPHSEKGMWIAVKSDLFGQSQFCIVDIYLKMSRPFSTDIFQEECSISEVFSVQDTFLLVLSNCWSEDPLQEGKSKLFMLNTLNGMKPTEPMPLYGEGDVREKNIYPTHDGFWIKTTSLPEGFGYLTYATWDPARGLEKKLEYSFSNVGHVWEVSIHPTETIVAVAYNHRLEIVGKPFNPSWIEKFEEPITYIDWYSDTVLLVGIGGKLFQVNIKEKSIKEWFRTQSGIVSKVIQLPFKKATYSPQEISNGFVVEEVQFRSERAGKDVQAIWLGERHPAILDWEVTNMCNPVDWLLWYQNLYFDNTYLYFGLLPYSWGEYIPSMWLRVKPIIHQELVDNKLSVLATRYVRIRVIKNKTDPRRILFVWAQPSPDPFRSDKDPRELKTLIDMLSGTPYYFSCSEISELINDNILSDFGTVVIEAKAIASGIISIKDLLDYVFQGGNLLIIGDYWPEGNADLFSYWLMPIGILYNPNQRFDGELPVDIMDIWNWKGKQLNIIGGGTLKSISNSYMNPLLTQPEGTSIPHAKPVACVMKDYGYGKIAVLSSRTPLTSTQLRENDNKAFAVGLFQRLTYSETRFEDTDGDSLFDTLEDRNQNGIVDEGETNLYIRDSDKDGVPDGDEDQNRNGKWDENETDPTCEDSDGDGIWDGADISPVPAFGKQIITRINPSEAYAEGGTVVFVQGRNFTNDTQFIFGSRFSPSVRILSSQFALVVVPEFRQDEGGKLFVYTAEGKNKTKIEPGKPFLYKPRNKVEVTISHVSNPESMDTITMNVKRIKITPSAGTNSLKRVFFLLRIRKGGPPEIKMENSKWNVKITHIKDEWYLMTTEWGSGGFAFGSLTFDIVPIIENMQEEAKELYVPEIVKVWAETAYRGRLTVEMKNEN